MTTSPMNGEGSSQSPNVKAVSPWREMGAYEDLWSSPREEWQGGRATFKRIADHFAADSSRLPSDFVDDDVAKNMAQWVANHISEHGLARLGVRIHRAGEYPEKLRDAAHPVELLYYSGDWDLVHAPAVAVVGSRKPSEEGLLRAKKLARLLIESNWTVVSGLAAGIDQAAHRAAMDSGGRTIAVIGTPLTETYPKEHARLQEQIAKEFLIISQVPFKRYTQEDWRSNRRFFPERNITMSALTTATVIVEAAETSGTLIQAKAALRQRRKLFILDNCFQRTDLTWPEEFEQQGAIRVRDFEQILEALSNSE